MKKLANVDVKVIAEIGKIDVPVRDVLSLQGGDVIRLYNTRIEEPYSLDIGNKPKFQCCRVRLAKNRRYKPPRELPNLTRMNVKSWRLRGEVL